MPPGDEVMCLISGDEDVCLICLPFSIEIIILSPCNKVLKDRYTGLTLFVHLSVHLYCLHHTLLNIGIIADVTLKIATTSEI